MGIYNLRIKLKFNRDDGKILFNYCLWYLISLEGLDVKLDLKYDLIVLCW